MNFGINKIDLQALFFRIFKIPTVKTLDLVVKMCFIKNITSGQNRLYRYQFLNFSAMLTIFSIQVLSHTFRTWKCKQIKVVQDFVQNVMLMPAMIR